MELVIHAQALRDSLRSQAFTGVFDERGGTIGRSDTNTLTLPDPERHVSRLQAEVLFAGGGFAIRNVGSANAIELNGRALEPGDSAPLVAGDQLVIGGYALRVVAPGAAAGGGVSGAARPTDARTVIRASASEVRTDPPRLAPSVAASPPDPFADLWAAAPPPGAGASAAAAADPFADLLGSVPTAGPSATPVAAPVSTPVATPAATPTAAGATPPAAAAPTDAFDPFADLLAPPGPAPAAQPGPGSDPMAASGARSAARAPGGSDLDDPFGLAPAGLGGAAVPASLDALFGLGSAGGGGAGAAPDALADFLAPPTATPGARAGDVLDLFAERPADRAADRPAAFNHTPELAAAYVPPAVVAPAPVVPPPPPSPLPVPAVAAGATPSAPSAQALWAAFCDGAGLNPAPPLPQGLSPQMMHVIGQLLHHAVEGTLKLAVARAGTKQELRAPVTIIQARNNNPLKFSVDPQAALTQLLQPPARGFLAGPEAVRDVMDDLLGHHFGTLAGMRAALAGVLQRFEPAALERKLATPGLVDTLLPMNRRARLWDLYVEHCRQVQDEAQDDFHTLFGKAFVKAYEEQLDQLQAARGARPPC